MRRVDDIEGRTDDVFVYPGGVVVHSLTFRSLLGRERNVVDYQVHQTLRGATVSVCTSGVVDLVTLTRRIADSLGRAGVPDSEVTIEQREAFERQASGKLKRFFPLRRP